LVAKTSFVQNESRHTLIDRQDREACELQTR
jgi:hypothetical protein